MTWPFYGLEEHCFLPLSCLLFYTHNQSFPRALPWCAEKMLHHPKRVWLMNQLFNSRQSEREVIRLLHISFKRTSTAVGGEAKPHLPVLLAGREAWGSRGVPWSGDGLSCQNTDEWEKSLGDSNQALHTHPSSPWYFALAYNRSIWYLIRSVALELQIVQLFAWSVSTRLTWSAQEDLFPVWRHVRLAPRSS